METELLSLENYFDFLPENYIRLKGTRIGLEHIVQRYQEGVSPEEITLLYPGVSLEQAYAAITYYLANQSKIDQYIVELNAEGERAWQAQQRNPTLRQQRLKQKIETARQQLGFTKTPNEAI